MSESRLAYTFWHWPKANIDQGEYELRQRAFHAALGAAPSPGFQRSMSFAVTRLPWAAGGANAYEDWYLVNGSAALDPLNDAAVSASRRVPHDAAAAAAAGGIAGLYSLRLGEPSATPSVAYWFSKPSGLSYEAFWERMRPLVTDRAGALWGRKMTLGPTPEFCLHLSGTSWEGADPLAITVPLRRIA